MHRRDHLRASKVMADRTAHGPKIAFAGNSEISAIHGEQPVTGVTLRDTRSGEQRELAATGVFVAVGHVPRTELLVGQVALAPRGTSSSRAAPPRPTPPASSHTATPWTTPIARRSPRPGPDAQQRSTRSASSLPRARQPVSHLACGHLPTPPVAAHS